MAREFPARLRARRRTVGLTLAEVASKADLSVPYLANLERGRGNPTLAALESIASALDTTVSDLLGGDVPAGEEADRIKALAGMPASLRKFAGSERFRRAVDQIAQAVGRDADEVREQLLVSMATAPRRGTKEPSQDDWSRLLHTYQVLSME